LNIKWEMISMVTKRYRHSGEGAGKGCEKWCPGLKGTTNKEKCEELGLQTLVERRDRQDMA